MKKICVVGLGFVGAPLAVALSSRKEKSYLYKVFGIDQNNKKGLKIIRDFNNGFFQFNMADIELKKLLKYHTEKIKNLKATSDINEVSNSRVVIITISCNLINKKTFKTDYSLFINNLNLIFEKISSNTLIILESTVPPGTCEEKIYPNLMKILKKNKIKKEKVYFAYSYERVMPGSNYLKSITNYWRVYSGINSISSKKCKSFYKSLIDTKKFPLTELKNIKDAEMSKVLENSYRAVNIAFIEEWKKFSKIMKINLNDVLAAIRKRPTHNNIMGPGFGVGGYCLTKDPLFGSYSTRLFNKEMTNFRFSEMALKINKAMPNDLLRKIKYILRKNQKVLIVGASYKKNIGDTRYSASENIYKGVSKITNSIDFYDPYISYWPECKVNSIKNINKKINYDLVIFLVNHDNLKKLTNIKFKIPSTVIEVGKVINSKIRKKIKYNKKQKYINY